MTTDPLRLTVLGTAFEVSSDSPGLLEDLARLWSPFLAANVEAGATGIATDAVHLHGTLDGGADSVTWRGERAAVLTADLNRMSLERYKGFAAHAGVVALGRRVVAMPASSGTGKTTMVAACIASGWNYISDEALCVRYDDKRVEPFPKPLALSVWSAAAVGLSGGLDVGAETLATFADLGGRIASIPNELTDIVKLERTPSARTALTALHRADAVPLLLGMSFNHYRRRAESFALVTGLAQACRTWTLSYSDPLAAADCLNAELG